MLKIGLVAAALCTAATLTGCGPGYIPSQVGLTVDSTGRPVIVLEDCRKGELVELQLFDESRKDTKLPIAQYTTSKGAKSVQQIPLATGDARWKPVTAVPELRAGTSYKIRSWAEKHQSFGGLTVFTPEDLQTLKPGEVRYGVQQGSPDYKDDYRVTSLDEFAPARCD
ncbi:hypothetical protein [Kribbella sp. NPDC051770]|uniref:hypothetical protein n=1 Tax=Kribbella sp. NPDC051770 TaxID=3155413 RepID=UPI003417521B